MAGKGTTINLGGRDRTLRFDLNALDLIGEKLGITVRLGAADEDLLGTPLPLGAFRTILWAGLRHESPDLTEHEVGGWVDQDNLREVIEIFFGLFGATGPVDAPETTTETTMAPDIAPTSELDDVGIAASVRSS